MSHQISNFRKKLKYSLGATVALSVFAQAMPAHAKIVKYCVVAKTADVTDAGTTGYPEIAMSGEVSPGKRVYSGWKEIGGDQDRDSKDTREFDLEDMGTVTIIDIKNDSSNAWKLHYVRIYRNTGCGNTSNADGYSEFSINKWIEDQTIKTLRPSDTRHPRVTVSKNGTPFIKTEEYTVANYASVSGQREQMVMQFKESWSNVETISMSTSTTTNVGASATLSYESPASVYGQLGASATASWDQATESAEENSIEKLSASEYDWSFVAPGNTFVIKKATFEVPYSHQLYKSSQDGKSYVIRTVGAQIIPSGNVGSFIEIPRRNNDGSITSIGLKELENNWFKYLKPGEATKIKRTYMNDWLAKGYVVSGKGGGIVNGGGTTPPVSPNPEATPTPTPNNYGTRNLVTGDVKGANMAYAAHGAGRFEETAPLVWTEFDAFGTARSTFKETGRGEWSVFLEDSSRNIKLRLDSWRKAAILSSTPEKEIFKITEFKRVGNASTPQPPVNTPSPNPTQTYATEGVNGENMVFAGFNSGYFEQTSPKVWKEFNASGTARFTFKETGRDEWSVYLTDQSRNMSLRLDAWRKEVVIQGQQQALYDVTEFKRLKN